MPKTIYEIHRWLPKKTHFKLQIEFDGKRAAVSGYSNVPKLVPYMITKQNWNEECHKILCHKVKQTATVFHLFQTWINRGNQTLLSCKKYCKAVEEEVRKISKQHSNSVKHVKAIFKMKMLYIALLIIFVVEVSFCHYLKKG